VADEDNVVAVMPVLVAALEMRGCADQDRRPAFRDYMVDLGEFVLVRARELVRQLDLLKHRQSVMPGSSQIRRVELRFGFAEKPDVPATLRAHAGEVGCEPATASFFLGREVPVPSLQPEVPLWQERIYAFMVRNAVSAPDYFLIPSQRVVELGTRVEI
jgi:K+ transporter